MNFEETIQYLYSLLPVFQRTGGSAYKANLDNILALDRYFNYPHKSFKTLHIAGTNGKGSVSHILASVLQESGLKTGLYTSPHLLDMRERIKVNGTMITKEYVVNFIKDYREIIEELKPSFFELMVMMSFCYFRDQKVEIAVIETGLGGRLDATNIISPILSIITNIALDHTQFLGTELEDIAKEKAGIIKPNVPVVIGRTQLKTKPVFDSTAIDRGATLYYADHSSYTFTCRSRKVKARYQEFKYSSLDGSSKYKCDLMGLYQHENISTALTSLMVLRPILPIAKKIIKKGIKRTIKNTGLLGRWQTLSTKPLTLCDTGHNPDGIRQIADALQQETYTTLHIVLGMVNDKPAKEALQLLPKDAVYYFTESLLPRALDRDKLQEQAEELGCKGKTYATVADAWAAAKSNSVDEDCIFIGGSTFIVADALKVIDLLN